MSGPVSVNKRLGFPKDEKLLVTDVDGTGLRQATTGEFLDWH